VGAKERKQFAVIKEGFARATFGGVFSGCPTEAVGGSISFAALDDNGGLNKDEFFATMARILSKAITPYRKFDFTKGDVLKKSVGIFEGLTLYANHNPNVNDWKGLVQNCVWDDKNNPAGINAMIVVDKTIDPKLARGLEIKALRSLSVTIWFNYEKSHPDLPGFYDRLGETVDGEVVRFIVTEITNAGEVSVVWEGEDPFAKTFGFDSAQPPGDGPLSGTEGQHLNQGGKDMKLTAATVALLGLAAGAEPTEAELETAITGKISSLETQIASLKPDAAIGVQTLKETRERAVTLYKVAKGEKVVETFISGVIEKADLTTARAFCSEYQTAVDESIPLACPKCGEKLTRRSSQAEGDGHTTAGAGKRADDYKVA
jgi:hypothetical protein